jgi:hypothetical protein
MGCPFPKNIPQSDVLGKGVSPLATIKSLDIDKDIGSGFGSDQILPLMYPFSFE